ncbi:hypothetical protein [Moorena sp. SIO3I8]|uniref:hypothetical protein n=1 Tax=Moorena sp. SIO3I8 TaxID=2607833 RepID=UPI0013C0DAE3|nr:hypothetical protein [Moorena sp. SIO3I8]NEO05615.1 hypothetical protein [Moorena sp. SIO3I8]
MAYGHATGMATLRERSRLPIPDSRLPIPDSRFPIPDSRLPTPDSRLPTADSQFPIPDSRTKYKKPTPVSSVEWASCPFPPYFRAGRMPTLLLTLSTSQGIHSKPIPTRLSLFSIEFCFSISVASRKLGVRA